jgi:hypothetical protein
LTVRKGSSKDGYFKARDGLFLFFGEFFWVISALTPRSSLRHTIKVCLGILFVVALNSAQKNSPRIVLGDFGVNCPGIGKDLLREFPGADIPEGLGDEIEPKKKANEAGEECQE